MWSIYDKELNEFQNGYTDAEICEAVKRIADNELDRASFYQFEDNAGKQYDCWDMNRKFNLKIESF